MIISRLILLSVRYVSQKFIESTKTHILDSFAKLRKATAAFVISVWNNSAPIGRIFVKYDMRISRKSVEKIQVTLKYDKKSDYYT